MRPDDELSRTRALILAGGRGERLYPLTLSRPKPVIPFGGAFRIIDFTLSNCVTSGLNRVSLLTQYRHRDVHDYVRHTWGASWLTCFPPIEGRSYRGTADAVRFGRTFAYDFRDRVTGSPGHWRDIGTIDSYFAASMEPPSLVRDHAFQKSRVSHSVIFADVSVGDGVVIEDSILFPRVQIGNGARLRRVIVEEGVRVPAGFEAGWNTEQDRKRFVVTDAGVVVLTLQAVDESVRELELYPGLTPWARFRRRYAAEIARDASDRQ